MQRFAFRLSVIMVMAVAIARPAASVVARTERATGRANAAAGQVASSSGISPKDFLKADGTLSLEGNLSGSIDLTGWDVSIDSQRGPVFAPTTSMPATASPGAWADLGYGAGDIHDVVLTLAIYGGDLIAGGTFTDAGNISEADYIARWDGSNWNALGAGFSGNGALNGSVWSLLTDGSNLYAGGGFVNVWDGGGAIPEADYIARWDGTHWHAVGGNGASNGSLNGYVNDMVKIGGDIFMAGGFSDVNNGGTSLGAADYVARWDGSNWSALSSNGAGNGSLGSQAVALATDGSNLYVGGMFVNVNNSGAALTTADFIAKWDGANWSALSSNGAGEGSLNSSVYALTWLGGNLYAGGAFTNVRDGLTTLGAADYVTVWNGSNWAALGSNGGGGGSLNNQVTALVGVGSNLYVGGGFFNVYNGSSQIPEADYLARWDTVGGNWYALGSNGSGNGSLGAGLEALCTDGTNVYAGGYFEDLNDLGTPITKGRHVAAFDGTHWTGLGANQGNFDTGVSVMAVMGTDLFVGGNFTNLADNGVPMPEADYVARWDGAHWHALGSNGAGNGSLSWLVYGLAVSGTNLYVGGYFSDVNNNGTFLGEADYIARWDGSNWHALGSNGAGNGSLNQGVYALAVSGSDVYAAGGFTNVVDATNGTLNAADYLAKWDGSHWSALGSNGSGEGVLTYASVAAMATMGGSLYIGGNFTDLQSAGTTLTAADYVARWNGSTWSALSDNGALTPNGSLNSGVAALATDGSNLYVGGYFSDVNDGGVTISEADYVASWNGSEWGAVGGNGSGDGSLGFYVTALAVHGNDLYVGGTFQNVDDQGLVIAEADAVARWDGIQWHALGSNGAGDGALGPHVYLSPSVFVMAVSPTDVYVSGGFYNVSNNGSVLPYADYVAAYGIETPAAAADFEADGISDLGYFRASTGVWGVLQSSAAFSYGSPLFFSWGATGDLMVRGDYDGDGKNDPTVRKPPASGQSAAYRMLLSSTSYNFGSALTVPAGWPGLGDTPAVGDFNGDGIDDPAIFRGNTGVWIIPLSPNFNTYQYYSWGTSGDKPAAVDVDGDGQTDIGYWRPSTGVWGFLKSSAAYSYGSAQFFSWGASTDIPVAADYDGDALADIAVVIPASGGQSRAYRILLSTQSYNPASSLTLPGGWAGLGDVPVPQDYDGDGKADAGLWRGNTGIWIIPKSSTNNASYLYASWGATGDQVVK